MAIHVRSTRRAYRIWRELRIKLARVAVVAAISFILVCGLTLYLIRIFSPQAPSASFIAWQEPSGGQEEKAEQRSMNPAGAVNPVPVTVNPVIISVAEALPLPETIDIEIDDSEDMLADVSEEIGSGHGNSAGDGGGVAGGGEGGSGKGKGRGLGYNDDVQVVLALDASASMDELFLAVADSLGELLRTLGECRVNGKKASVNVGIVVYGQSQDNGAPFQLTPFTLKLEELSAQVKSVNCDGAYEACGEAIEFAVKNYPWNKRNRHQLLKVLFIAGNESFDMGAVNYRQAMSYAKELGIIVNTIHCGPPNPEWIAAARLGGGAGLDFDMNRDAASRALTLPEQYELIERLYSMPLLPVGSPAEQAALQKSYAARPPLPNAADEAALRSWIRQHLDALLRGSRGDAVKLCCQLGEACTLDALGGRGNLPPELRSIPEDGKIIDTLKSLAQERREIIQQLRSSDDSSFIGKVLNTLIQQAAERGIDITR